MTKRSKPSSGDWRHGLNARQQRFCEEYLIDLNATQAGLRAGYGAKSKDPRNAAHAAATRLRAQPKIANAIALLLEQKPGVTRTMIVTELAAIAQSDIIDFARVKTLDDLEALPPEARRAIKSLTTHTDKDGNTTVELVLWDKVLALSQLARATGLHVSRAQINVGVGVTVEDKSAAHARLFAQLDAIAGRLPAPNDVPLLIDATPIKDKDIIEND